MGNRSVDFKKRLAKVLRWTALHALAPLALFVTCVAIIVVVIGLTTYALKTSSKLDHAAQQLTFSFIGTGATATLIYFRFLGRTLNGAVRRIIDDSKTNGRSTGISPSFQTWLIGEQLQIKRLVSAILVSDGLTLINSPRGSGQSLGCEVLAREFARRDYCPIVLNLSEEAESHLVDEVKEQLAVELSRFGGRLNEVDRALEFLTKRDLLVVVVDGFDHVFARLSDREREGVIAQLSQQCDEQRLRMCLVTEQYLPEAYRTFSIEEWVYSCAPLSFEAALLDAGLPVDDARGLRNILESSKTQLTDPRLGFLLGQILVNTPVDDREPRIRAFLDESDIVRKVRWLVLSRKPFSTGELLIQEPAFNFPLDPALNHFLSAWLQVGFMSGRQIVLEDEVFDQVPQELRSKAYLHLNELKETGLIGWRKNTRQISTGHWMMLPVALGLITDIDSLKQWFDASRVMGIRESLMGISHAIRRGCDPDSVLAQVTSILSSLNGNEIFQLALMAGVAGGIEESVWSDVQIANLLSLASKVWPVSSTKDRLSFLRAIALSAGDSKEVQEWLWQRLRIPYRRNDPYIIRREICTLISRHGTSAWKFLGTEWTRLIEEGYGGDLSSYGRQDAHWNDYAVPLAHLGWLLPRVAVDVEESRSTLKRFMEYAMSPLKAQINSNGLKELNGDTPYADIGQQISLAEGHKMACIGTNFTLDSKLWMMSQIQWGYESTRSWLAKINYLHAATIIEDGHNTISMKGLNADHPILRLNSILVEEINGGSGTQAIWGEDSAELETSGTSMETATLAVLGMTTFLSNLAEVRCVSDKRSSFMKSQWCRENAFESSTIPPCLMSKAKAIAIYTHDCNCEFDLCGPAALVSNGPRAISDGFLDAIIAAATDDSSLILNENKEFNAIPKIASRVAIEYRSKKRDLPDLNLS